jgi:predicted nucleic acid-binding protein
VFALKLGKRYTVSGTDLPDLIVMSMAHHRKSRIVTWDFRHFQSVVLKRGQHWLLLVAESELPLP